MLSPPWPLQWAKDPPFLSMNVIKHCLSNAYVILHSKSSHIASLFQIKFSLNSTKQAFIWYLYQQYWPQLLCCVCHNANIPWHVSHSCSRRYNKLLPVLYATGNPSAAVKSYKTTASLTLTWIYLLNKGIYKQYKVWISTQFINNEKAQLSICKTTLKYIEIRNSTSLAHTFYISK